MSKSKSGKSPKPPPASEEQAPRERRRALRPLTEEEARQVVEVLPALRRFARMCVSRSGLGVDPEDLVSEAITVFYELADEYDPAKGTLVAYGLRRAKGRILDIIRRERKLVFVPDQLMDSLSTESSDEEPVRGLDGVRERIESEMSARAVDAVHVLLALSPEDAIDAILRRRMLAWFDELRDTLPARDRLVLESAWDRGLKAKAFWDAVGKSRAQAQRDLRDALERLAERFRERPLAPAKAGEVVPFRARPKKKEK